MKRIKSNHYAPYILGRLRDTINKNNMIINNKIKLEIEFNYQ